MSRVCFYDNSVGFQYSKNCK